MGDFLTRLGPDLRESWTRGPASTWTFLLWGRPTRAALRSRVPASKASKPASPSQVTLLTLYRLRGLDQPVIPVTLTILVVVLHQDPQPPKVGPNGAFPALLQGRLPPLAPSLGSAFPTTAAPVCMCLTANENKTQPTVRMACPFIEKGHDSKAERG